MDAPLAPEVCRNCGVALDGDDESIAHYSARTSFKTYRDRAKRPEATDCDMASAIAAESILKAQCALVKAEREVTRIEKKLEEGRAKRQRTDGDEVSHAERESELKAELEKAKAEVEKAEAKAEKAKAEVEKAKAEENLRTAQDKAAASFAASKKPDSTVAQQVEARYDETVVRLREAELQVALARTRGEDLAVVEAAVRDSRKTVDQFTLRECVGRLFEDQDLDGRLSHGDVKYTAAIKRAMGIADEEAELAGVELLRHNSAAPFEWAAGTREDDQYKEYTSHLSESVPIDGEAFTYVPTGTRFKGALTTKVKGLLGFTGTTDIFVCPPLASPTAAVDTKRIAAVLELKTTQNVAASLDASKAQAVGELLAAATLSRIPVVSVLTDLGSTWHFWWLERGACDDGAATALRLVHHHSADQAHGYGLWRDFCARFASVAEADALGRDAVDDVGGGSGGSGDGGKGVGPEGASGPSVLAGRAFTTVLGDRGSGAISHVQQEQQPQRGTKRGFLFTEAELTEMLHLSPDDDEDTRWAQAQQLKAWYFATQGFEYSATEGAVRPSDAASTTAEKRSLGGHVLSGQAAVPPQERVESFLETVSNA
eukprot:TRINITY_DN115_c0_g1_i9.p1 TRINITY_DN115_c0_g1~~TRINITY_DN115_c0_g1_i9.p1  ORF type:complete len:638 (+),score=121.30 TRINITY_DN115_c0_g1_i9:116-1915(+)